MKRFTTSFAAFIAGLPLFSGKSDAVTQGYDVDPLQGEHEPVTLRPLNLPGDNLFAAHRSHSSHGSHRSHRSSSGGGGSYRAPAPYTPPSSTPSQNASQPVDPGRPAAVSPSPATQQAPTLSIEEKKRLQVMRVQIALTSLGLYTGTIDGIMGPGTQNAIKQFQSLKGISPNGLMSTDTLNALGVPAVQ